MSIKEDRNLTLIATSASDSGIAMAVDSAVTLKRDWNEAVTDGARKLFLLKDPLVGISCWGFGTAGDNGELVRFDEWMGRQVADLQDREFKSAQEVADEIERRTEQSLQEWCRLNSHAGQKPPWGVNQLRGGVHIAGFAESQPEIWHVTTGSSSAEAGPPATQLVFPQNRDSKATRSCIVSNGPFGDFQLWNGATTGLDDAFSNVPSRLTPEPNLSERIQYLGQVISFVANRPESGVNDVVYSVGFTADSLVEENLPPGTDWHPEL